MPVTPVPARAGQQARGGMQTPCSNLKLWLMVQTRCALLRGSAHNLFYCFFHPVVSRDREVLALAWEKGQGKKSITLSILVSQA